MLGVDSDPARECLLCQHTDREGGIPDQPGAEGWIKGVARTDKRRFCGYCQHPLHPAEAVELDPCGEQWEGVKAHSACSVAWQNDQAEQAASDRRSAWMA